MRPLPQTCAQVLVTLDNLADRGQYINVRNTFTELLAYGVVPVVNENVSLDRGKVPYISHLDTLGDEVLLVV